LDLLPSDIFKARVIGAIPDNEQDSYTSKWEDVEVTLGRDRFNKLFVCSDIMYSPYIKFFVIRHQKHRLVVHLGLQ